VSHNSLVSGPNLTLLESYESLKSVFSNEKSFIAFGPAFQDKSSAQFRWSKLGKLDRLAFEADLEGK